MHASWSRYEIPSFTSKKRHGGITAGIRAGNLWTNGQFSRINLRFESGSDSGSNNNGKFIESDL